MTAANDKVLGPLFCDADERAPVLAKGLSSSSLLGTTALESGRDAKHPETLARDPGASIKRWVVSAPKGEAGDAVIDAGALAKAYAEFGALQRSAGVYEVEGPRLVATPLVYHRSPESSTAFTLRSLPAIKASRVLELGTGTGAIAIVLARAGNRVLATDIREDALRCARSNAAAHGAAVELRTSDVFAAIAADERFDAVIFNILFRQGDRARFRGGGLRSGVGDPASLPGGPAWASRAGGARLSGVLEPR